MQRVKPGGGGGGPGEEGGGGVQKGDVGEGGGGVGCPRFYSQQGKWWMGSSEAWKEPTGEQIQKKSNSLIEAGNYRWYMKMQAWTSQSRDNAQMPKKMFQATS